MIIIILIEKATSTMRILHIFTDQNYVYTKALISMFYNSDVNIDFDYLICADKTKIPHDILEIDSSHSHVFALTGSKRAQVFKINAIDGCYDYIIYHFFPNDILKITFKFGRSN